MAKKNRKHDDVPAGMSRRQAKLAARAAEREALAVNPRPFAGLAAECDIVAMREFVPAATLQAPLRDTAAAAETVTVATVLPGASAAMVRDDGARLVGIQTNAATRSPDDDLSLAIQWAASTEPGTHLANAQAVRENFLREDGTVAPLGEVVDLPEVPDITVYEDFSWWFPEGTELDAATAQAVRHAEQTMMPSARLEGDATGDRAVVAAWWVNAGDRAHLRWVRPEEEGPMLKALARLRAADALSLGEGSKFAGIFRTHGLVVPVWDLDVAADPQHWAEPAAELAVRLGEALARTTELNAEERRARDFLNTRQVTLRL